MKFSRVIFLALTLSPILNYGQQNVTNIDSLAAKVIKEIRREANEHAVLETVKPLFAAGETIWFKAFLINSVNGKLSDKSKTLYVDLVNDKDSSISVVLLHANAFQTAGGIELNDSLTTGQYWLRAYTSKMVASDLNSIAIKPVYVINPYKPSNLSTESASIKEKATHSTLTSATEPTIQIFPEGNHLISGTNSTVALKIEDKNGTPYQVAGILKDRYGKTVTNFTTNKYGLGKFTFSPTWSGKYSIFLQNNDRYDSAGVLPPVNLFSGQISVVEQTNDHIKARVMLEDSIFKKDYTTYVLGINKDSLCFAAIGKGMYELNIPVSNFPSGISELLLFGQDEQLLSSRKIYINKKDLNIEIKTDKPEYSARENVELDIHITDPNGKPQTAALAVAVVDSRLADTLELMHTDSLSVHTLADTDLFMLTSSSDSSPSAQNNTSNTNNLIKDTFDLKGTVLNKKSEPASNQIVVLMNNNLVLQDTTDMNGKFSFYLPDYYDSTQFNLQVNNMKNQKQDFTITIDPLELPHFNTPLFLKTAFDNDKDLFVQKINKSIDSIKALGDKGTLKPVTVSTVESSKKKKEDASIITQDMMSAGGMNNVGQAVLRNGKFHLVNGYLMSGGPNGFAPAETDEPGIILDGIQIKLPPGDAIERSPVLAYLKTISTTDIEYIRVLAGNEASIYGVRGGHGIIDIHTTTKLKNYTSGNGITTVYPKGFHVAPEFKSPDYPTKQSKKSETKDNRTTIYWNGDIVTDSTGNATINFYTADIPVDYIITVTGVTASGIPVHATAIIKRKK